MMKNAYYIYKTKPIEGYKMGDVYRGRQMVAIPEKKLQEIQAVHKELCVIDKTKKELSYMTFRGNEIAEAFGDFIDKFGREEEYRLCYFEWKPIIQHSLFN